MRMIWKSAWVLAAVGMASAAVASEIPDTISLKSLSNLYEPVKFDHARHIMGIKDCAACHHHAVGTPTDEGKCKRCHAGTPTLMKAGCSSCHPADPFSAVFLKTREAERAIFHRDTPGLKAAYHRSCTACHEKTSGPTGCLDCHPRTEAGDQLYRSGKYVPTGTAKTSHH